MALVNLLGPRVRRLCLLAGIALMAGAWIQTARCPLAASAQVEAAAGAPVSAAGLQTIAITSCASTACHGGNAATGTRGSEYTIWATDKHSKAFQVLFNGRSQRITANLKVPTAAHENPDCLNCHVMERSRDHLHDPRYSLSDGVSCESCHGSAEKWLTTHYLPEWQKLNTDDKAKLGMRPTKGLIERAKGCVQCHVGSAEQEVNHDLIAAGHPRLNFEFSAFLATMPKHWSIREEKERYPDFEARAWALGQVVSAQAALELLAHRADAAISSRKTAVWPGFAEYDCAACHHELASQGFRRDASYAKRRQRSLVAWGTWYTSMTLALARHSADADADDLEASFQRLQGLMSWPHASTPDPHRVAHVAKKIAKQLEGWLREVQRTTYDATTVHGLLRSMAAEEAQRLDATSWDQAAQLSLAIAALYHARADLDPESRDPALEDAVRRTLKQLGFPLGFDSKRGYAPGAFLDELGNVRKRIGQ
jgi:hypothetical protein